MKKLLPAIASLFILACACSKDEQSTWDEYTDWRDANNQWLTEMQAKKNPDGTPYYSTIVPSWNPGAFVLVHYFNDRKETEGNLSPIYTSTIKVRYQLHLYDGTPVDSSDNITQYGAKGIYQCRINQTIQGWGIALPDMRCGDTAEVIVPYGVGYGAQSQGSMKPYSNLRFNIRLVDIPHLESTPY